MARRGFERVVIVITNHSHDDSGDLYIGPDACATVDEVSTWILIVSTTELMMAVFSSWRPCSLPFWSITFGPRPLWCLCCLVVLLFENEKASWLSKPWFISKYFLICFESYHQLMVLLSACWLTIWLHPLLSSFMLCSLLRFSLTLRIVYSLRVSIWSHPWGTYSWQLPSPLPPVTPTLSSRVAMLVPHLSPLCCMCSPIQSGAPGASVSPQLVLSVSLHIVGLTRSNQVQHTPSCVGIRTVLVYTVLRSRSGLSCTSRMATVVVGWKGTIVFDLFSCMIASSLDRTILSFETYNSVSDFLGQCMR